MSDEVRTVTYDCVPVTLVHPRFAEDLTIFYVQLPRNHPAYRRTVIADILGCLQRLRTWFKASDSIVGQIDKFVRREMTWSQLNYVHINTSKCEEWQNAFLTPDQVSDYDVRILFTLFPRSMTDEAFGKEVHSSLMF